MVDWPHAPLHRFNPGTFFITAGTLHKQHFFRTHAALDALEELLFSSAAEERCDLQAWCLLSNHYHLVVQVEDGASLQSFLRRFHSVSAKALNMRDGAKGRQVWLQLSRNRSDV